MIMQIYGIDMSKEKFDVNFIDKNGQEKRQEVQKTLPQMTKFLSSVPQEAVLCVEHTGSYSDLLVFVCNCLDIKIALISGYTIKHSLGLKKGKSDPIDALNIREYGERFFDKLTFAEYASETITELRSLNTLRDQLVKMRKMLVTGEESRKHKPFESISVKHCSNNVKDNLDKQIKEVEKEIETLIKSDEEIKENYEIATSVIGVGPVITTSLIIKTGNFKEIDTAKKASSYAGVAPFPNSSGKMVKKSKTSPFADKELKSVLYMGAKSAVTHNKELRLYYQKKLLEGKHHYLIMNNISNKLLRTIYSIIKSRESFDKDYICLDPRKKEIE